MRTVEGNEVPLEVAVDLGASHAISLNVDNSNKLSVPNESLRAILGRGVGHLVSRKP